MDYKSLVIALAVSALPMFAQAHSSPDEDGVCYKFSGDKVKDTQSCIISSDGIYTNIKMNNRIYLFEGMYGMDGECDYTYYSGGSDSNLKPKPAIAYTRDGIFHKRISQEEAAYADHLLYCYKTPNRSLDICHN
ncbi:hypothetical protein ACT3QO_02175 [Psychrobacter sp. AOP7-D1-15]|uniref:hypothetical protein n=1 Tax=unclassified Psychrobacter TaxID=196806 RepID=UPI001865F966|nr:hypothetical protein [Psychrobacter sp. FME61]